MNTELSPKATEIAEYAQSLLAIGGYNSFSYADIAERVRITKATIHHHFPSKAELVRVVVARYREQAREGLAALNRQMTDPLAQLNAYVDYWSTCIRSGSSPFCICAMLAVELPTIPDEVAAEVRGHFQDLTDWLTSVLEKGVATGQFHLQDSSTIEAKAFMAGVHGAMLAARGFGDPGTFQALVQLSISRLTSAR
ncbi:TetR/AcrR family transcriptional regulator [Pseudomonas gingeri]|uniref:TetR/AcrR family transcriptional regulator n=1 Tax=Pseudomonas gingeri TaxID=117681 RepID=A0A7Y7WHM2_9PSED|nr:TetR/AcrR family transcriptional regulator [Pseudomonas gingeri]NWB49685.1 TetR/AcrR family transcriptional regulator [Pseudomonas gingeri]